MNKMTTDDVRLMIAHDLRQLARLFLDGSCVPYAIDVKSAPFVERLQDEPLRASMRRWSDWAAGLADRVACGEVAVAEYSWNWTRARAEAEAGQPYAVTLKMV